MYQSTSWGLRPHGNGGKSVEKAQYMMMRIIWLMQGGYDAALTQLRSWVQFPFLVLVFLGWHIFGVVNGSSWWATILISHSATRLGGHNDWHLEWNVMWGLSRAVRGNAYTAPYRDWEDTITRQLYMYRPHFPCWEITELIQISISPAEKSSEETCAVQWVIN